MTVLWLLIALSIAWVETRPVSAVPARRLAGVTAVALLGLAGLGLAPRWLPGEVEEAREALAKAQRDARRRVVDLGCGAGRDFPAFEERNIDYLGVDASEGMLTVARERFPSANFEAQDLCKLDLPARGFDGAFAARLRKAA